MNKETQNIVIDKINKIEDLASMMKAKTKLVSHIFRELGKEKDTDLVMVCMKGLSNTVEELDDMRLSLWSMAYSAQSAIEKDEESKEEVKEEDGKDV